MDGRPHSWHHLSKREGQKKTYFGVFCVGINSTIDQKTLQCMASLASRYSEAVIGTRPFVTALCAASAHVKPRRVNSETKACIVVWRAIALMLFRSNVFSCSIIMDVVHSMAATIHRDVGCRPKRLGRASKQQRKKVAGLCQL